MRLRDDSRVTSILLGETGFRSETGSGLQAASVRHSHMAIATRNAIMVILLCTTLLRSQLQHNYATYSVFRSRFTFHR